MDDRLGALERVDRLAVLRQVGLQLLLVRQIRVSGSIDADDVVAVLEQVADDRATRLAGTAGDDDAAHRAILAPADATATRETPSLPVRSR